MQQVLSLPVLVERKADCTLCELCDQSGGATSESGDRIIVPLSVGLPSLLLSDSLPPSPSVPAVVFIGQNPGYSEDIASEIFVGRSGVMVRGGSAAGVQSDTGGYVDGIDLRRRASVYLTNAVRCWTAGDKKPKPKHIKACLPYLLADLEAIAAVHPLVVLILMGDTAVQAWFKYHLKGKGKKLSLTRAFSFNGHTFSLPSSAKVVTFTTYHPAYVLRSVNYAFAVHDHFEVLNRFLDGIITPRSKPRIVPTRRLK